MKKLLTKEVQPNVQACTAEVLFIDGADREEKTNTTDDAGIVYFYGGGGGGGGNHGMTNSGKGYANGGIGFQIYGVGSLSQASSYSSNSRTSCGSASSFFVMGDAVKLFRFQM